MHVEPLEDARLRERAHAAAVGVPRVREVHNLALVEVDGRTELSLHVKLPGDLSLDEAHEIAEQLEGAICAAVPEIAGVQTHLEPLAEATEAREVDAEAAAPCGGSCARRPASEPRELRFLRTTTAASSPSSRSASKAAPPPRRRSRARQRDRGAHPT